MPHIANTPESIVSRSDSRNPATTCTGVTANGLPCRRALPSPDSSPAATPPRRGGRQNADPASFYCWQHKDQAPSVPLRTSWRAEAVHPQPRTSIDTLMDRLGVLEINDVQDPEKRKHPNRPAQSPPKRKAKRTIFCCFETIDEDEPVPPKPVHPSPEPQLGHESYSNQPNKHKHNQNQNQNHSHRPAHPQPVPQVSSPISGRPQPPPRATPAPGPSSTFSQTKSLLSWIPSALPPQTTSRLLTELAKPISSADEPGYIYIFWVTPSTSATSKPPSREIASSLIPVASAGADAETPEQTRRVTDAIRTARELNTRSSNPRSGSSPGTVRLKIGRASNVQRRLNEWTRQCSNHLTLIRYYPYAPSSASPSAHQSPSGKGKKGSGSGGGGGDEIVLEPGRKVPHVHRVERLIHIELGDMRLRDLGQCQECGKEHREWFEVAAERAALKRVDECIRRWVKWAESQK
ncbi:hypothetical protein AOCH_003040 [Aspergillus ochraceoroseus]|uniref:Bacteriophage T5 Orf172 DNA-binding domain-containing protein n=1 Tax=Aspergillus ochraceoroseus TaxID=138278 RepID=A0A0F8X342_9EURO|nr:hypothetical protein AOCH_003040 [Aspergillus ochraceoroseus]